MSIIEPPEIEPPHLHHRSGGLPRWLEWTTSIAALIVSVSSIVIAVHNGHNADKALEAQTYPYVDLDRSDALPDGTKRLSVGFVNNGVGPAHEQSFKIKVGERYMTSLDDLIANAIGPDADAVADAKAVRDALHPLLNAMPTRFIPANSTQFAFSTVRTEANAQWWDPLDKASRNWRYEVCYCSVFHECWVRHDLDPPQPVKACHRDEPHEFNP